jgi:transcriptional regulator with XRE-family HTH domain
VLIGGEAQVARNRIDRSRRVRGAGALGRHACGLPTAACRRRPVIGKSLVTDRYAAIGMILSVGRGSRQHRLGIGRSKRQADGVGSDVKAARAHRGVTREQLAARAGVSEDSVRRIELGDPHVQLNTLCAVGEAIGLDVVVKAYPGRQASLRDRRQLATAEAICSIAHARWTAELEVAAGIRGEATDVCFFSATEILATEIDRLLLDFQDQYRRQARKRDYLAERHERPVRLVMVIEDTARNRNAIAPHREFLRRVLPAGSREILKALRTGADLGRDGILWVRPGQPRR